MTTMDRVVVAGPQLLRRMKNLALTEGTDLNNQANQSAIIANFEMAQEIRAESKQLFRSCLIDEEEVEKLDKINKLEIDIDAAFGKLKALHVLVLRIIDANKAASVQDKSSAPVQPSIRLAPINLIKFDGSLKMWPTFRDLFNVSVHTNSVYSNIEKFHLLITHLSGELLSIVKSLPISDGNYPVVYESLTNRYENKRLLVTTYWQSVNNANKATSDSPQSLRNLVNSFTENLAALDQISGSLNPPASLDLWDFTLFNWMLSKLDASTRKRFELENSGIDFPTFNSLKEFVLRQCKALEVNNASTGPMSQRANPVPKPLKLDTPHQRGVVPHAFVANTGNKCVFCKSVHLIYQCPSFLGQSPQERYQSIKNKRCCINCLRNTHLIKDCPSKSTCRKCQAQHHTLLHFENLEQIATNTDHHVMTQTPAPSDL
ncbi:hypothetical protein Zmor_009165 [Zophobas morio]|uniref:CCHC-type domain-containing protein n=1 Tax=Zophobas morio TaxID=2755281 RepID=A0AA38IK77_9CUCU|nr:hypothetical protein Zmor_009165 [Zophobas morio]